MESEEEIVITTINEKTEGVNNKNYSVDMIETMFADSLSRGMQNAIISQQNAQMASSASITNACARILQARAEPTELVQESNSENTVLVKEEITCEHNGVVKVTIIEKIKKSVPKSIRKLLTSIRKKLLWLMSLITALICFILFNLLQPELAAVGSLINKELSQEAGKSIGKEVGKEVEKEVEKIKLKNTENKPEDK